MLIFSSGVPVIHAILLWSIMIREFLCQSASPLWPLLRGSPGRLLLPQLLVRAILPHFRQNAVIRRYAFSGFIPKEAFNKGITAFTFETQHQRYRRRQPLRPHYHIISFIYGDSKIVNGLTAVCRERSRAMPSHYALSPTQYNMIMSLLGQITLPHRKLSSGNFPPGHDGMIAPLRGCQHGFTSLTEFAFQRHENHIPPVFILKLTATYVTKATNARSACAMMKLKHCRPSTPQPGRRYSCRRRIHRKMQPPATLPMRVVRGRAMLPKRLKMSALSLPRGGEIAVTYRCY